MTATKRRTRKTVFFLGIDSDIRSTIATCEFRQVFQVTQEQESLLCNDQSAKPFESVFVNFFQVAGKSSLVIKDRLSRWTVVVACGSDTTATRVIRMFCRYVHGVGVPIRLLTGGESPFNSADFRSFMEHWSVHHTVSSPHHSQSNGHTKAAVKATKYMILKMTPSRNMNYEELDRSLLELRNTHTPAGR